MPVSTALLRRFEDLSRDDVDYAGGKGANLGELTAAGLPVPPGFVVGAPAYAAFCDAAACATGSQERLAAVDVDDTAALERAAKDVRVMVEDEPVPDEVAQAIRDAYLELAGDRENPPVAVRSSATAEDTESASFAGMNETFLNVRGADARCRRRPPLLGLAVRRPHRLLPRQARLRPGRHGHRRRRPAPDPVDPRRRDVHHRPGLGRRDRLVIEGSFGLGESVVSGSVSPDRYVVDKETLHIAKREVQAQGARDRAAPRGRHRHPRARRRRGDAAGAHRRRGRAASPSSASAIEEHYGAPQDTEWAFDDGRHAWMLQSRPVTASAAASTSAEPPTHEGEVLVRGLGAAPGVGQRRGAIVSELAEARPRARATSSSPT